MYFGKGAARQKDICVRFCSVFGLRGRWAVVLLPLLPTVINVFWSIEAISKAKTMAAIQWLNNKMQTSHFGFLLRMEVREGTGFIRNAHNFVLCLCVCECVAIRIGYERTFSFVRQ